MPKLLIKAGLTTQNRCSCLQQKAKAEEPRSTKNPFVAINERHLSSECFHGAGKYCRKRGELSCHRSHLSTSEITSREKPLIVFVCSSPQNEAPRVRVPVLTAGQHARVGDLSHFRSSQKLLPHTCLWSIICGVFRDMARETKRLVNVSQASPKIISESQW